MTYKAFDLSYIVPVYQENEINQDFEQLIHTYSTYSPQVLEKILFIFVDDCSPVPFKIENSKINYTLLRITDDIRWNQGGARNLGVHTARTNKIVVTDLDHIFPEKILTDLLEKRDKDLNDKIYKFRRRKNGVKSNSHPNTFFLTKATFFKSLGVDEEFCGNYGYEDIYFLELQKHLGTKFRKYRKNYVEATDHDQHQLNRDVAINKALFDKKMEAIKNHQPFKEHSRLFLNFNWKIVDQQQLSH